MNADYEAGRFECGDKVGILLDLGAGSMQFFKNGSKHGPGFPSNSIESPVVPALLMYSEGDSVKLLSNALHPAEQKKERAKQTKMAKQKQQRAAGAGAGAGAGSSHSVSVFGFSQLPTGSATKPTAIKPITPKQKAPKKKPKRKHQPK
jgi:hypothetical protein